MAKTNFNLDDGFEEVPLDSGFEEVPLDAIALDDGFEDTSSTIKDYAKLMGHGLTQGTTDEAAGFSAWLGTLLGQSSEDSLPGMTPELEAQIAQQRAEGKWDATNDTFDFMGTGEQLRPEELGKAEREAAYKEAKGAEMASVKGARDRQGILGMIAEGASSMAVPGVVMGRLAKSAPIAKLIEAAPSTISGAVLKGMGAGAISGAATGLTEGESDIFTEGDWSGTLKDVATMAGMGSILGGGLAGTAKIAPAVAKEALDLLKGTRESFFSVSKRMARKGVDVTPENIKKFFKTNVDDFIDETDNLVKREAQQLRSIEGNNKIDIINEIKKVDAENVKLGGISEIDDEAMDSILKTNADSIILDASGKGVPKSSLGIEEAREQLLRHKSPEGFGEGAEASKALNLLNFLEKEVVGSGDVVSAQKARTIQQRIANIIYKGDSPDKIGTPEIRNILRDVERNTQNAITLAVDGEVAGDGLREIALSRLRKAINLQQRMKIRKKPGMNTDDDSLARTQKFLQYMTSKTGARGFVGLNARELLGELDPKLLSKYDYLEKDVVPLWNTLDKLSGGGQYVNPISGNLRGPISEFKHSALLKSGSSAGKAQAALDREAKLIKSQIYNKVGQPLAKGYDKVTNEEIRAMVKTFKDKGVPAVVNVLNSLLDVTGKSRTARMYALTRQPAFREVMKGFAEEEE